VLLNRNDLRYLKVAYEKAIREKKEEFNFRGQIVPTTYAKYLIEYLTDRFYTTKETK
jgi:hypothetical protein